MSMIALILIATVCINGDRQTSARQYSQKTRGQMGFKWTRQYAQKPAGPGYGSYGSPKYPFGKATPSNTDEPSISSTENTESTTFEPTEEGYDIDNTFETSFEYEPETSDDQEPIIMNCVHDKCAESFNACFNDQQCKEWMLEWQENGSLNPECSPSQDMDASTEKLDEEAIATFETTESADFDTTDTIDTTTSTIETTYDETTVLSTSTTENTETLFSSTEILDTDVTEKGSECQYTELFWKAYNCVDNYCYMDQLKLAQSHQNLIQSPSNYRVSANVKGSKSSSTNWTILIVAVSATLGAIVMFEIIRRLYKSFQEKIQYQYQCECMVLRNAMRYFKNKWEQIRGYKYEKTHHDLAAIEESDDAEMYGIESDKEESIETTNKDILNNDSDISDDVELQRTDDDMIDTIDDQFVHSKEEESVTKERQEIRVEAVQEPIQEL